MTIISLISCPARKSRDGSAVFIVLVLLMVMAVLAAANTSAVNRLRQRVKIVDQSQTHRLASYSTNSLRATGSAPAQPNSDSK